MTPIIQEELGVGGFSFPRASDDLDHAPDRFGSRRLGGVFLAPGVEGGEFSREEL